MYFYSLGSEYPGFPETYFVVQNNDLVSVKYLLLFIDKKRNHSTYEFFEKKKEKINFKQ